MLALIAVAAVAFCNLALGLIVLLKNRRSLTNVSFAVFAFMLAAWLICNHFSNDPSLDNDTLLWLNRATFFLSGTGLFLLLLFNLEFTRTSYRYSRAFAVFFGLSTLAVSVVSTTPLVIAELVVTTNTVIVDYGPFIALFLPFVGILLLANIVILMSSIPRLHGAARVRTKIMAGSLFLALAIAVITNIMMPIIVRNYSYRLIGSLSTFIIVGGFSYAIIRHRLFDIRAVLARSIAHLLLLALLGAAYGLITFEIGDLLFSRSDISTPQRTFNVVVALILALTFQPLKQLFEKLTDRVFYRARYDPQKLVNEISQVLASEIDLVELTRKVRNLLAQTLRVRRVDIVVLHNDTVFHETGRYVVSQLEDLARDLGELRGKVLVTDEEPEGKRKETLQQYGISVLAVLRTREEKIGYLLFGEKLSVDIYSSIDLRVITIIADELAIAIENAKSYAQVQNFNRTLQGKIEDATKQLREANNSLQQLDQIKDEFISMASHQLRTPLTVVEGYLANILDGIYGPFNERQNEALVFAQSRLRLTSSIVADLLNLSRIEAGRFFIEQSPVDLNRLVSEEVEQLKIKANHLKSELIYTPPTNPVPTLTIDEPKTRQVIMNLVDNALNYSSPNGRVMVKVDTVGNQVVFTVTDNGIGVPEEEQAKLFNKFYRATNAKQSKSDGTGIGLYLVKRVVEQQGGSIIFTSKVGKGSTFGFRLPVTPVEPTKANAPQPQLPAKRGLELQQVRTRSSADHTPSAE